MGSNPEPASPDPSEMTYEAAIEELESLIDQIEEGAIGLEASLEARRRGEALIRRCRSVLERAEQELRHIEITDEAEASDGDGA